MPRESIGRKLRTCSTKATENATAEELQERFTRLPPSDGHLWRPGPEGGKHDHRSSRPAFFETQRSSVVIFGMPPPSVNARCMRERLGPILFALPQMSKRRKRRPTIIFEAANRRGAYHLLSLWLCLFSY